VKHNTIAAFFAKYPTPTAALAAKPDEALAVMRPLGLFPNRFRSVVEVSSKLLTDVGAFEVGPAPPSKIYGVGRVALTPIDYRDHTGLSSTGVLTHNNNVVKSASPRRGRVRHRLLRRLLPGWGGGAR
jgi:hypothetical protein